MCFSLLMNIYVNRLNSLSARHTGSLWTGPQRSTCSAYIYCWYAPSIATQLPILPTSALNSEIQHHALKDFAQFYFKIQF